MNGDTIRVWILTIVAALGAIAGLMRLRPDRTRAIVESASSLVTASDVFVGQLRAEMVELQEQVKVLRANQRARDTEIANLRADLRRERLTHEREVSSLSTRVAILEKTLHLHDIPVPPDKE